MSRCRLMLLAAAVAFCLLEGTMKRFPAGEKAPPDRQVETEKGPLPPGASARLGSLRLRHELDVLAIAFAPDGKKIASVAQNDAKIRVWETSTGKLLHDIEAPAIFSRENFAPEDYTMAFTPDGQAIAAGVGADVCFWDVRTGQEIRRCRGKGKGIVALTFARDGKTFYCGGSDNKIYQWDIATGKQVRVMDYFEGKQPRIHAKGFAESSADLKAIAPDGTMAVWLVMHWADQGNGFAVDDWQVILWDPATGKARRQLANKNDKDFSPSKIVLSPDGKYLTAYDQHSDMIVWDAATGKKLKRLGNGNYGEAVAYSSDSRRVAALIRENCLCVWDLPGGNGLWHQNIAMWYAPRIRSLAFSPHGKTLALAQGNNVRIWDVESAKETPLLEGHRFSVHTLAFSLKGGVLVSADDACVCEWDVTTRQAQRHARPAYHGHTLSAAESYEAGLRIFQPKGQPPQLRELISDKVLCEFDAVEGRYHHGCFSKDGRTVALSRIDKNHEIVFLDVPSRRVRSRFVTDEPLGENLILSCDGTMLAATRSDQTVLIIDSLKGAIVRRLVTTQPPPKENEPPTKLTNGVFSPDGQLVAFGTYVARSRDRFTRHQDLPPSSPGIRVWQVDSGRELRQFENCLTDAVHARIASLRFTPDSKSLAVALNYNPWHPGNREEAAVPVFEVASGRLRRTFKGHTDQVDSLAFFPDGRILATGSRDSTILLWDMKQPVAAQPGAGIPPAERLRLHWSKLAALDPAIAYDAVLALADLPDPCVPFLAERLKPIEPTSNEQLTQWVADLNSKSYKVREEASTKLTAVHDVARPALKKALNGDVSLEVRRRIEKIVEPLDTMNYSPALMRELRSVEILERVANKEARSLLEVLAAGAPEAPLTIEARASLARLKSSR